ncbi:MAG: hypothetical protein AB1921_04310 [Thermodesulfobacteriota bacterium]
MVSAKKTAFRNYMCPQYSLCLDRAARINAKTTPCHGCKHAGERVSSRDLVQDLPGVLFLLMAVFSKHDSGLRRLWEERRKEGGMEAQETLEE